MSKEDSEIDIIKDFLKSRGYKNALDGLEKDDYKTVEKKKVIKKIIIFFKLNIIIGYFRRQASKIDQIAPRKPRTFQEILKTPRRIQTTREKT